MKKLVIIGFCVTWAALVFLQELGFLPFNLIAQYDFHRICKYSNQFQWGDKSNIENLVGKTIEFHEGIKKRSLSLMTKNIFRAIAHVDGDQKWPLLQQAASQIGMKNFECEGLRTYYSARP